MESEKYVGTVVWFNNSLGYGFISRDGEKDMFVHYSDVASDGFKTLKKGQVVAYSIGLNNSGKPKATEVTVIEDSVEEKS